MDNSFTRISRRSVLQGLGVGTVLAAAPLRLGFAQGTSTMRFITAWEILLEQMHELNAIAGGHMADAGIEVEMTPGRGTSLAIQQVVADQADISRVGALDLIKASAAQDTELVSVGVSLQEGIFDVVSLADKPINNPQEMRGKVIGVASIGGGTENMLNLMLSNAGVPVEEVERQAVGSSPGNVELLKQGRLDAFMPTVEGSMVLRRADEPVHIWGADRFAPMPGGAIIVRRDFAEANGDTVAAFMKAMHASAQELLVADPNDIIERVEAQFEISANEDRDFRVQALTIYNYMALSQGRENLLRNVPQVWANAVEQVAKAGIAEVADPESLYTNEFIDAAM